MSQLGAVEYSSSGHEPILDAVARKHGLVFDRKFHSGHSACGIADSSSHGRLFVKVKGYAKTPPNRARLRRAIRSATIVGRAGFDVAPTLIESAAFERGESYWLVTVTVYGGEPLSSETFFAGEDAAVGENVLERLRCAILATQQIPAASFFYDPPRVAAFVASVFGRRAPAWASHWVSAHCDLHWGNVLAGGKYIVDWDMFALAPAGFDAANLLLNSVTNPRLFRRLHVALADSLGTQSARVAILFAAARMLTMMRSGRFAGTNVDENGIREAVQVLLRSGIQ